MKAFDRPFLTLEDLIRKANGVIDQVKPSGGRVVLDADTSTKDRSYDLRIEDKDRDTVFAARMAILNQEIFFGRLTLPSARSEFNFSLVSGGPAITATHTEDFRFADFSLGSLPFSAYLRHGTRVKLTAGGDFVLTQEPLGLGLSTSWALPDRSRLKLSAFAGPELVFRDGEVKPGVEAFTTLEVAPAQKQQKKK